MKDKVLVLGSDFCSYDLVCEAQNMGYYVIATDLMESSPTKRAADEAWLISTTDHEILERKIKEENIKGILVGASEFNIEQCRAIAKDLNLPLYCESDNAWGIARDKGRFKKLCRECGVPVATDYFLTDDLSEDELKDVVYPVVVKPVDKSGNRGMSFCYNQEELVSGYRYARSISDNSNIVVERMLKGPEFTGYYVLDNGNISLSYYTSAHHQHGELSNLYSLEVITSYHLKQYIDEVNSGIIEVFKKAGCKDGVAWIECMYDEDGHFYVLEMGYRFAGPTLYVMHNRVSGFNSMEWMVECAVGKDHRQSLPCTVPAYRECVASYNLFTNRECRIAAIKGLDKIEAMDNIVIDMPKREGDTVRFNANMGVIRIYGVDSHELCATVEYVNQNLQILDDNGNNIYIKFTDYDDIHNEYKLGLKEFGLI